EPEPEPELQPVAPPSPPPAAEEDELDEELVEIFVEEAGEVLETLAEYTPQWQADLEDDKALAEVRRAFHTLKGSGRMVRAGVLAELAWAVENMLNRVLDRSIEADGALFQVVNAVRGLMPRLVEDFAAGRQQALPEVGRLTAQAEALARGEALPDAGPPAADVGIASEDAAETLDPMVSADTLNTEAEAEAE
ncbi:MAG TPA: hypothetical protein DEA92_17715, partial [Pseudomonas sp.]|nr:hypothetical protein [Pseudomonas sp.]